MAVRVAGTSNSLLGSGGSSSGGGGSTTFRHYIVVGDFPQRVSITPVEVTEGDTAGGFSAPLIGGDGAALPYAGDEEITFTMLKNGESVPAIDGATASMSDQSPESNRRYALWDFSEDNPVPEAGAYKGQFKIAGRSFPERPFNILVSAPL